MIRIEFINFSINLELLNIDSYFPIQKIQATDVSTLSEDWATNSQHD